jgi:hypothetical protein
MFDKAIILAKIESTYGTDPTPVAASDAILCSKPTFKLVGARRERDVVLPYYGKLAPINVGEGLQLSFAVELRGAGALPDTPPRIGALIRACNFTETIDSTGGSESTIYAPNSAEAGEGVTIYFYKDAVLHKALGCVGTFKISAKVNEVAKFDFEFTGLYAGTHASDDTFPTPTFGDSVIPPILRSASFSIHSYSAIIDALEIDIANAIAKRSDANVATGIYRYFIGGRDIKGSCDPEAVVLSTFNPWSLFEGSTSGALSVTIGDTSQNRCIITQPVIVPDVPEYGEREGIVTYAYAFTAHPTLTGGNNEISIKFD